MHRNTRSIYYSVAKKSKSVLVLESHGFLPDAGCTVYDCYVRLHVYFPMAVFYQDKLWRGGGGGFFRFLGPIFSNFAVTFFAVFSDWELPLIIAFIIMAVAVLLAILLALYLYRR